ncbi:DUF1572 family protein [Virgibacillus sp. MG-45]|uniref:DUF1572 family protein n=1 Tax=Virgibacillus sp. MG-45 TaxID=3102791 RepID=UPI002EDA2BBB
MQLGTFYLQIINERFSSLKDLGEKTLQQLEENELHWVYHSSSNSIAVIVKHLSGNMLSRWTDFLTTDGEKPFRKREQEFEAAGLSVGELMQIWNEGWDTLFYALGQLEEKDLLKKITIRGEQQTVLEAIERQLAHYAYHVGQMVLIGKQLKGDNWESLSIPKGKSEEYLEQMLKKHQQS